MTKEKIVYRQAPNLKRDVVEMEARAKERKKSAERQARFDYCVNIQAETDETASV